jgi:hypothetical protein
MPDRWGHASTGHWPRRMCRLRMGRLIDVETAVNGRHRAEAM